jgi:hypothetical protein
MTVRQKTIHIDTDAFYASVEPRDDPNCAASMLLWPGAIAP